MSNSFRMLTLSGFLLVTFLGASPALALSPVTFVSGKGSDTGTCASPANPCSTFQFAIGQTSAGGEIKALDPANYGGIVITKSISLTGIEGAGIGRGTAADAITINAGANDRINLSHLTLEGFKIAQRGIVLIAGGSLTITDCVVRNFTSTGIILAPAGAAKFLIKDTLVSDNSGGFAIFVVPPGTGSATGTLKHVSINRNFSGLTLDGFNGGVDVTAIDSVATNNVGFGFSTQGRFGVLRLAHSAALRNGTGVGIGTGATAFSFGDNDIRGNATNDVQGTLTPVGKQ